MDDFQAEFEKLTQLDQEWREHFTQTNLPSRADPEAEEKRQFMFDSLVSATSLQEVLLEQARTSDITREQWGIAEMIIGNIDDYGYLNPSPNAKPTLTPEQIIESLAFATNIPQDKILEVLRDHSNLSSSRSRRAGSARMLVAPVGAVRAQGFDGIQNHCRLHGSARQTAFP